MSTNQLHLLLADDDMDDCILFEEALKQLKFSTRLTLFHYGDQLMQWLKTTSEDLPDALFLDLNMPRKTGFQCLVEIRENKKFNLLPVFIISTSYEKKTTDLLYKNGASFYIQKPTSFLILKKTINQALTLLIENGFAETAKEKFVLSAN